MNVTTEEIRSIPAGAIRLFACENGKKVKSARSLVAIVKESGDLQEGVVNYETRKYEMETGLIFAIRAMREGDEKILRK